MFRAFAAPEMHDMKVEPAQNTIMPWLGLAQMTDEDLGAIYDYLRTVPPIANVVEKRPPPKTPTPAAAPAEPVAEGAASGAPAQPAAAPARAR